MAEKEELWDIFDMDKWYAAYRDSDSGIRVEFATEKNLNSWMSLVEVVRDNFPGLETAELLEEYRRTVIKNMDRQTAVCALFGNMVVGILLFSVKHNMLSCMAVHPEFRRKHIATRMFEKMLEKMDDGRPIVVETFREEDEKGAAPRAFYKKMGFEEGELCLFNDSYPEQKFYLRRENLRSLTFTSKELIDKGWSGDRKYCVTAADGKKYLLRVTPEGKAEMREEMFRMQRKVAALGVSVCEPVEFGRCEEGVYSVETWVDGKAAEDVIPQLAGSEQYAYGLEAGRILKTIHSIPAPEDQPDWEARFNRKMDRKIKMYGECPVKFAGAEHILAYIEQNRHLLKNRPQCFQHGDYHIGNMMVENGRLVIIDFDRYDFGDPWEEFNRIVWSAQASPLFATGIVDGYFDKKVPPEFWKLLALYISSNMLSSIPWAIPFGEDEVNNMLRQARDVLNWYDSMKNPVPKWYCK